AYNLQGRRNRASPSGFQSAMIRLAQQLDKSQVLSLPLIEPKPALPILAALQVHSNLSLLGNEYIQAPPKIPDTTRFFTIFYTLIPSAQPTLKLELLKRQKFTPEKREQRIRDSLAALNAPQPTTLTLAQWKEIVDEVEDENDDGCEPEHPAKSH